MVTSLADEASALEAEAERYPDERGEIFIEAAQAWQQAGQPERAITLLTRVIDDGGEDGCFARVELAELYLKQERVEEGYAELDRLARDPALGHGPSELVAELLAERGDLEGALRWYDRSVARLSDDDLAALRGPDAWLRMSSVMLRSRRTVRRQLGLPPDAMDELALTPPDDVTPGPQELREPVQPGRLPSPVRMSFFPRAERSEAQRRWPEEGHVPAEEYYRSKEQRWRELAESGVPAIPVVPLTVAGLCAFAETVGGSPLDSAVKRRYSDVIADQVGIAWPPPRNGPCWCGSGAKYKKCCGQAG